MAKLNRKKGTTSQILHVFIQDSSSTIGAGLTGLAFNTASLACRYINAGGTISGAITLEDITTLGTYQAPTANTNMKFKEVSSASPSQGVYEIHLHNDWMNLTGGSLVIMMAGATNMAQFRLEIDLATNSAELVDDIWDEVLTGATHNVTNSAGKLLRLISAITTIDGTVNDAAATTTYFISDLTNTVPDFYKDSIIVFTSGALSGQARPITAYNGTTKRITVDEAWTSAPANAVAFTILSTHVHPVTQISAAVWDELSTGHTDAGKAGQQLWTDIDAILVDTAEIGVAGAGLTALTTSILTTALTESYATDGTTFTLSQALYMLWSALSQFSIASTTITCKKLDGTTTAMTFNLDSATSPTLRDRNP